MTAEAIHIGDFPPFIRFELDERIRREIFSAFHRCVSGVDVDVFPEEFWRSAEGEFEKSRYQLLFGFVRGKIMETITESPLRAGEIIKRNPEISPFSIYHALIWLKDQKLVKKKGERWELKNGYFDRLRVSDLAKVIDLREKGVRRKNALSLKDLEMAVYLWPLYEHVRDQEGIHAQSPSYGSWYHNQFALARAVKEWDKGHINVPQWALIAMADLIDMNVEEREAIASYSLPPGVKVRPYYKGRYKIPIELSSDFDVVALQLLLKSADDGLIHPVKRKKAIFKRLHHTFGSFESNRVPLSIREIIEHYYQIPKYSKTSFRIPARMKERWETLPHHEKTLSKILVLEMLFGLDQPKRTYELISRSKGFLGDVSSILTDLGVGDIRIHKRNDRPHYRSYLPKKVNEKLKELKESVGTFKIEEGIDFIGEKERAGLITLVKNFWGENGVNIISNLSLDRGVRDLDLARASGVTPKEVRKILYELIDKTIVTYVREETPELVEYYYYLSPEGIKKFLAERKVGSKEKIERSQSQYPFPDEFVYYQRRRSFSEAR